MWGNSHWVVGRRRLKATWCFLNVPRLPPTAPACNQIFNICLQGECGKTLLLVTRLARVEIHDETQRRPQFRRRRLTEGKRRGLDCSSWTIWRNSQTRELQAPLHFTILSISKPVILSCKRAAESGWSAALVTSHSCVTADIAQLFRSPAADLEFLLQSQHQRLLHNFQ